MAENKALVVPEYLKKFMAVAKDDSADSMASSSISVPRISLRAKKFRYMEGGEEVKAESETDIVILSVDPGPGKFVKTFYEGSYNSGDSSPPTCSSSDGIRPDSWVTTPQSQVCANCPKNQFGSATSRSGKKSKACRDAKRLWVVRPDALDGTVYGVNVPVTSLKNLAELGQQLKSFNVPISAAVVHMAMEDDESFPILKFSILGWLNEESGELAINRNKAKDWPGANPFNSEAQTALPPPAASVTQVESRPPIEGTATPSTKTNDVNAALKNWD